MIDIDKFIRKKIHCDKCKWCRNDSCEIEKSKKNVMCRVYEEYFDMLNDFQKEFCYEIHKQICAGISISELDRKLTDIIDF